MRSALTDLSPAATPPPHHDQTHSDDCPGKDHAAHGVTASFIKELMLYAAKSKSPQNASTFFITTQL